MAPQRTSTLALLSSSPSPIGPLAPLGDPPAAAASAVSAPPTKSHGPPAAARPWPAKTTLDNEAIRCLRQNTRSHGSKVWCVPSADLYPHQWAWDSAFIALGFAEFDVPRAIAELRTLLNTQWSDGRIPHIAFHTPSEGQYFPSPSYYGTAGTQNSSTISQPPVWTLALALLRVRHPTALPLEEWLELAERCEKSHLWFRNQRDPLDISCVGVAHPWESGMDNSPAWDEALAAVDPSLARPFVRLDTDKVHDAGAERPTDAQYRRYASIVTQIADSDSFAPSEQFFVYDPCLTAILARAESELSTLYVSLGLQKRAEQAAARSAELVRGIETELWKPEIGKCAYYDAVALKAIDAEVIGAYMPLCTPGLSSEVSESLLHSMSSRGYLDTKCPIPSVPMSESTFEPLKYWRGPAWVNVNFLLFAHLPDDVCWQLAATTINFIHETGEFYEYFEASTGRGLGAAQFSWTAALLLHWGNLIRAKRPGLLPSW